MRLRIIACVVVLVFSYLHGQNYYPLKTGNSWKYKYKESSSIKGIQNVPHLNDLIVSYSIAADTMHNNVKFFKVLVTYDTSSNGMYTSKDTSIEYLYIKNKFVYCKMDLTDPDSLDLIVGKTEYVDNEWFLDDGDTIKVSKAGAVEVNGKKYENCFKVTYDKDCYFYAAPDTGIIRYSKDGANLDLFSCTINVTAVRPLDKLIPASGGINRNDIRLFDMKGRLLWDKTMKPSHISHQMILQHLPGVNAGAAPQWKKAVKQ